MALDSRADCARVEAPTLVITGESTLDRVVPVDSTREYVGTIRGARCAMLERTGHIGPMTRPEEFAAILGDFAHACADADRSRRTA